MKFNRILSFMLASTLLGYTAPAHSMQQLRRLCRPITAGVVAAATSYGYKSNEIDKRREAAIELFHSLKNVHEQEAQLVRSIDYTKTRIITELIEDHDINHYWDSERKELSQDQFPENLRKQVEIYRKDKKDLKNLPYKLELQKQLQDFARENHNLEDVFFGTTSTKHGWAADGARVIVIPESDNAYLLEKIADHKGQNIFNDLDDKRMALIQALLHHECGHVLHESSTSKTKIESLQPAIMGTMIEFSPNKNSLKYLMRPRGILMTGIYYALSRGITNTLALAFGKYDERRADDTVPNDPRLLKAGEDFFRIDAPIHDKEIIEKAIKPIQESIFHKCGIQLSEYFIKKSLALYTPVAQLFDEHPSNEFRAERFKTRLAALENNTKS